MKLKSKIITSLLALALAFTAFTAVNVMDDNAAITAEAASIKLSTKSKTIGYKQSFNLSIKNTGSKTVKWSTSNMKVAKIKKVSKTKYKVTAVKPGTATIKAKVGGKTYKCKVTVKKICHTTKTLAKGATHTLGLKNVKGTVKWSTSNKKVASIKKVSNKKCKVTAKKAGTATIKAKVNGKTYKCKITVCKHNWVATKHAATGHYENVKVKDAYDEKVSSGSAYVCNGCGYTTTSQEKIADHVSIEKCSYSTQRQYETVHHDAVYEQKWVQDSAAYTTYKCSKCGSTK